MQGIRITLTKEREALLHKVQREVNRLLYISDKEQFGKSEYWTDGYTGQGDCEDFAEEKQKQLIAHGFPELCMARCSCLTEDNESHAVLVVNTSEGYMVLDNRYKRVCTWQYLEAIGYDINYRPDYLINYVEEKDE